MKLIDCNNSDFIFVQVKDGDNLESILNRYSVTINNIIRNNPNIDLYEGEIIKILRKMSKLHIVKPMETLNSISQKYDISIDELVKLNNLTTKRLFIGQSLRIDD